MSMHDDLLARASGADLAHLWMNLAKILVLLVLFYQDAMLTQLGVSIFAPGSHYVLQSDLANRDNYFVQAGHVDSSDDSNESIEHITLNSPVFKVPFVPISVAQPYESVQIEVTSMLRDDQAVTLSEETGVRTRTYPWPGQSHRLPPYTAVFDLRELADEQLQPGRYQIGLQVRFQQGDATVTKPESSILLQVLPSEEAHFGHIVVARGQSFEIPRALAEGANDCRMSLPGGAEISCNQARARMAAGIAPGSYEQSGTFARNGVRVPFGIAFIVQDNLPPRGTQDENPRFLRLFSDWFVNEGYINLSQFIVDPDGKNDNGTPNIHVQNMVLSGTTDFRVEHAGANNRCPCRLVPTVSRPPRQRFTLIANDEFQRGANAITVEFERVN